MKSRLDEAMAKFQKAIDLKENYPEAHYNLGNALRDKGHLHKAIAQFQKAIDLKKAIDPKKGDPRAHYNLGLCLLKEGRFADGLKALKRADELGSKDSRWRYPSRQWVLRAAKLVALEGELPTFLKGETQPADAGDRIELAQMCQQHKGLYAAAARFYADAFVAEPKLAERLGFPGSRYDAACVAALAGCGQGKDATQTDDKERARLRRQALAWLRADLAAWRRIMVLHPDKASAVRQQMQHWQEDTDFAGVRGPAALGKLPADERPAWQKLWVEVAALARTHQKPSPEKKAGAK
jgi:tetratricopeptide (TPR) repeat protein